MSKHKLVDVSLSRDEKEEFKDTAIAPKAPEFPFGLSLHLEEETIEKLGIDKLPSPGTEQRITAIVRVESASIRKDDDGTKRSLSWQITKLEINEDIADDEDEETSDRVDKNKGAPPKPSAADVLFTS